MSANTKSKLEQLLELVGYDVFTDAFEYTDRVECIARISDELLALNITKDDIQFLIWALGFVEGRVSEMPLLSVERRAQIMHQCKEIWPKLSGLL